MFEQTLLAAPRSGARGASFVVSLGAQMAFLTSAMIVPLFLVEGPGMVRLHTMLMAPPPPPPPPNAMKLVEVPANVIRRAFEMGKLYAPTIIPDRIAKIEETDLPATDGLVARGASGVPGGIEGGVPGGILNDIARSVPPPPTQVEKPKPVQQPAAAQTITRIRTSSGVQSAKLVKRVIPAYPPLAKQARIQGTVKLMGILTREGRIMQLQVLSGHPLLVPAALDAVKQWVYEPTLLNGEPVEVVAPIDVNFTLSQ